MSPAGGWRFGSGARRHVAIRSVTVAAASRGLVRCAWAPARLASASTMFNRTVRRSSTLRRSVAGSSNLARAVACRGRFWRQLSLRIAVWRVRLASLCCRRWRRKVVSSASVASFGPSQAFRRLATASRAPRRRRWTTGPSGGPRPCGAPRRVRRSRPEVRTLPIACTEAGVRRCRRDVRHRARGRGVPAAALRADSRIYDGLMDKSDNHTIV